MQNAFISVWNRVEDGQEIDHFKQYMYAAVRNHAMAILRTRKNNVPVSEAAEV